MEVDFKYLPEFERRAKDLAKKYKSFVKDYDDFLDSWIMFLMPILRA